MNYKVKYAKLHTEYFSVGTGNLSNTLEPEGKHKGMEVIWTPSGLFVDYKGVHFVVSQGNVVGCTFYEKPNLKE
jgi:hypothetical protein